MSPSLCPHHPHGCGRLPGTSPHLLLCVPDIGWWFCQMKTKRGWVPASYLEPLDSPDEAEDPDPNYAGAPCPLRQCGVWERKWVRGHEEASSSSVIFKLGGLGRWRIVLVRKVGGRAEGHGVSDVYQSGGGGTGSGAVKGWGRKPRVKLALPGLE